MTVSGSKPPRPAPTDRATDPVDPSEEADRLVASEQARLDEALEETFPASDPIAVR